MSRAKPSEAADNDAARAAAFLRSLAARAESDPALAATLQTALEESGLVSASQAAKPARTARRTPKSPSATPGVSAATHPPRSHSIRSGSTASAVRMPCAPSSRRRT